MIELLSSPVLAHSLESSGFLVVHFSLVYGLALPFMVQVLPIKKAAEATFSFS
ncbi:hypothetical protein KFE96_17335 [Kordiimonas sp. SCSIO 12603]|uniref:hypothetical protein n=1 Tax=Kordiimonas sp. SCSIO 12603 TaxID=2829596 RepID=UPI0021033B16|nr:hypothetical protein [Kordiimonas sp. SCSIO 12603]UTW58559.1 hypothetical protein KFE96_17335 [Kordiimonas sp. SCSIO 12603]